jgi:hypothetical protein
MELTQWNIGMTFVHGDYENSSRLLLKRVSTLQETHAVNVGEVDVRCDYGYIVSAVDEASDAV